MKDETFDYVIVGAGPSAIGLVLGLLESYQQQQKQHDNVSQRGEGRPPSPPPISIAILERGIGPPHASSTFSPRNWFQASHEKSSSVTLLNSSIQKRIIDIPIGRGIGGTSNINTCLCIPPCKEDFDSWPVLWRNHMMSSVTHIYETLERNQCLSNSGDSSMLFLHTLHNQQGKQKSSSSFPPVEETIFPSVLSSIPCMAQKKKDRSTTSENFHHNYLRTSYYDGLLEPLFKKHPQLRNSVQWFCGIEVQRLLLKGNTVIGVEGQKQNRLNHVQQQLPPNSDWIHIYARKDVVLCSGAIESPVLLLTSGIGHRDDLNVSGIPSREPKCCAGVGRKLRDHIMIPRISLTPYINRPFPINGVYNLGNIQIGKQRYQLMDIFADPEITLHFAVFGLFRRKWLTTGYNNNHKEAAADRNKQWFKPWVRFWNPVSAICFVILKILLRYVFLYSPIYLILRHFTHAINICLMNPRSVGKISIRPKLLNPNTSTQVLRRSQVETSIDVGYLQDERDVEALFQGWRAVRSVCNESFSRAFEVLPGFFCGHFRTLLKPIIPYCREGEMVWFRVFANNFSVPYFHFCGTCAMKTDNMTNDEWVVDSELCVRGYKSIRVCDASVFPTTVSAPTALTCAAVGYLCGSSILNSNKNK